MTEVYGIMLKFWIEDHYEQEELFEKKLFTSYEKAMEYLLSNIKCDESDVIQEATYDGVDYIVAYDEFHKESVDEYGIKSIWKSEGAYWCKVEELELL